MAKKNEFLLKKPRRIETILVTSTCFAAPVLFISWDEMPQTAREEFNTNGPIQCEGGGVPGEWCESCRFGKVEMERDFEP